MAERREMRQDPYLLDEVARPVVLEAIRKHCALPRLELAGSACQIQPCAHYRGGRDSGFSSWTTLKRPLGTAPLRSRLGTGFSLVSTSMSRTLMPSTGRRG